jgi:predicted RNA methylase
MVNQCVIVRLHCLLTNRKQSLIRSKQTPDPSVQFLVNMQTTDLCLQYLDENPPIRQSVIDYGSGTGILAIAAVKLGANQALCVDNDPQAVPSFCATFNSEKYSP